jgi:LacI family transcriptional regulator
MKRRVTITDVADAAGVSVATVSKVINARYGVAAATSSRVQEVIEQLGYESSLVARSMRSHRTHVIGILVAEFEPFSAEILKGAASALLETDYELLAYTGARQSGGAGWEQRYLSRLSGTLIDGALVVTPTVVEPDADIPVVAIDPHTGPVGIPTVDSDSYTGALLATRHLTALGHRRIGFLTGRPDLASSALREAGYVEALREAGLRVDPTLVRTDGAHLPATELLTMPDRPTAIFAANDLSAIGVMDVARDLGIDVPRDLSVVGFDDIPESTATTPPLTTVHQPIQQMGATAVQLLVGLLAGTPAEQTHVTLPTSLVVRGTTRAV